MKNFDKIISISSVLTVMVLLFLAGPANSTNVAAASDGYGYSLIVSSGGGGGGGPSLRNHPALITPANTRTLENVPATGEQANTNTNANGITGAVTAGNTNITNYALGGILGLAIIVAGFFLWKKYK